VVPTHSMSLNNYNSQTFAFIIQQYVMKANIIPGLKGLWASSALCITSNSQLVDSNSEWAQWWSPVKIARKEIESARSSSNRWKSNESQRTTADHSELLWSISSIFGQNCWRANVAWSICDRAQSCQMPLAFVPPPCPQPYLNLSSYHLRSPAITHLTPSDTMMKASLFLGPAAGQSDSRIFQVYICIVHDNWNSVRHRSVGHFSPFVLTCQLYLLGPREWTYTQLKRAISQVRFHSLCCHAVLLIFVYLQVPHGTD
jgi:hypothetical protein